MWNFQQRNFGLDGIRALAITLVVVSHCTFLLPEFNITFTSTIRLLGATGVDIFFVLSGYLIGGLILKNLEQNKTKAKDLVRFWNRRWLRTLPNYFTVFLLNIVLIKALNDDLIIGLWRYIPFLQNFSSTHPDFFTEAWSLSIEEYAYIVLPLILYMALWIFKPKAPKPLFFYVTLCLIGLLYLLKIHFYLKADITSYEVWSGSFRKVVIYRLDAIYMGFVLVYAMKRFYVFNKRRLLCLGIGILLFLGIHLVIVLGNLQPETHLFFYSCIYLIVISLSIACTFPYIITLRRKKMIASFIYYISVRSYAIYLVNYSIVLLTIKRFLNPSFTAVCLYLILTIVIAELLYKAVEQPFLKYRDKVTSKP